MDLSGITLDVHQEIEIHAPIGGVFEGLLMRLSENNTTPDGKSMPMVLERWPGGRWFRELDGGNGHLWGLVQVIKPPTLLEVQGPLFMSYPAINHVQFRLQEAADGTQLALHHRALGLITDDHRHGIVGGWSSILDDVKRRFE